MSLMFLQCQRQRLWYNFSFQPLTTRQFSQTSRTFFRPTQRYFQEVGTQSAAANQTGAKISESVVKGQNFYDKITKPGIRRQVIFAVLTSYVAYNAAQVRTEEVTEFWKRSMVASSSVWSVKTITNIDLKRAQNAEVIQNLRTLVSDAQTTLKDFPVVIRAWTNIALVGVLQPYADATEGKRLCWKICLLNLAVYGAWKIKSFRGFMDTRFMHHPLSGRSYTLLTSMFSHRSFLHLLFNCLALESFGSAAYHHLFRQQCKDEPEVLEATTSPHFLAFFVTAGLFSGLVSHIVNAKFRYPRLVSQLASSANVTKKTETWAGAVAAATATSAAKAPAKKGVLDILPSLGASGAIYATVTMTALAFPESQVALFIPPSYPVNIQFGVGGLVLLDIIGIIRGWRMFDHWAHLSGAFFGLCYTAWGSDIWSGSRRLLHEFRQQQLNAPPSQSNGPSSDNANPPPVTS